MYDIGQPAMSGTVMGVIGIVNHQPTVEIKLRTIEDILTVDEAIETINRLRKAYRKLEKASRICEWFEEDDNMSLWQCGACSEEWVFEAGGPIENRVRFCPHCGARVVVANEREWSDEDDEWGYKRVVVFESEGVK